MKKCLSVFSVVFFLLCGNLSVFAQTGSFSSVKIGSLSSAPGSATRLTIVPYKHLNNWILNVRDTSSDAFLDIVYGTTHQMTFKWNTGIGIGTNNPQYKLDVNGTIRAKEIKVETGWADFVFAPDYNLPSLEEVEAHIKAHKHLEGIPSEADVKENGVDLGEMNVKLLQKVEELTLYMIQQKKEIESLKMEVQQLRAMDYDK